MTRTTVTLSCPQNNETLTAKLEYTNHLGLENWYLSVISCFGGKITEAMEIQGASETDLLSSLKEFAKKHNYQINQK